MTAMTRKERQESWEQDCWDRTAVTRQLGRRTGKDGLDRTARTGRKERTLRPDHDSMNRTVGTRQGDRKKSRQNNSSPTSMTDSGDRIIRT
jgi:hypothetical protein